MVGVLHLLLLGKEYVKNPEAEIYEEVAVLRGTVTMGGTVREINSLT